MPSKRPQPTKRVVIISDMHCGHRAGLTPPNYQYKNAAGHVWQKFTKVQAECWNLYLSEIKLLQPVHLLIVNADCIDGRGERSGGCELITGDRSEQSDMAAECIEQWKAKHVCMTRGTPYHTGNEEDWEDQIAKAVGAKIGDHEWVEVNGFTFDVKHHVGSSSVPHGRGTALARDVLWNQLWAQAGEQPRGDMVVRSHVHYWEGQYRMLGGKRVEAVTTPALQAMGTKYGARRCSGAVHWGVLGFDIGPKGKIVWRHEGIHSVVATRAKAYRV